MVMKIKQEMSLLILAAGFVLALGTGALADPAPPQFSTAPGSATATATLNAEVTAGDADLVLELPKGQRPGNLHDVGIPGAPPVTVSVDVKPMGASSGKCLFHLVLHVHDLPLDYKQTRYISFTAGDVTQVLPYTLTNAPPDKPVLAVRMGPVLAVRDGGFAPVSVVTGTYGVSGLHIAQSTLAETTTHQAYGKGQLQLCTDQRPDACPKEGITLPAHMEHMLWISGGQTHGQYDGAVVLSAREASEGVSSDKTSIYATTWDAGWIGAALLLAGLVLAWLVTNVVRASWIRNQWLLQAALLRAELTSLNAGLKVTYKSGTPTQALNVAADLEQRLRLDALEAQGLPTGIQSVFSDPNVEAARQKLETYLQEIAAWLSSLKVIKTEGLDEVERRYLASANGPAQASLKAIFVKIDALAIANSAPPVTQLRTAIAADLNPAPAAFGLGGQGLAPAPSQAELPPPKVVQLRLGMINQIGWLYVLAVTFFVGGYTLFLTGQSASYGTIANYAAAFLWGLGFPIGTQLAQSAVATALSATRQI